MQYMEVIRNPHFSNLAAIIRVPLRSEEWKRQHQEVPLWTLLREFDLTTQPDTPNLNKVQVLEAFTNLVMAIVEVDSDLSYTEDDMAWFVSVLDRENGMERLAILTLLKAWYSAPDDHVTPAQLAALTGTAESSWRNKAARGEIPGAVKSGKQWLLPVSVLRSQGVDVSRAEMIRTWDDPLYLNGLR